ncbi:MAG: HEAT repeat domain-containing protein [Sedimentisphaerales bacterium]|nr:HEAT repeat domain-containing protein [Sedimentisphaerales bacterium]
MSNAKSVAAALIIMALSAGLALADNVENNWNEFLHYTKIGRFDLAKGYAQALIESEPNALELLDLAQANPHGHILLKKAGKNSYEPELAQLATEVLKIIEKGRFIRRSEPKIIAEEIRRLTTTARGRVTAVKRLADAGEYAIPYMLDALLDDSRQEEWPNIIWALPQIGQAAIRPLAASLQMDNTAVKAEAIKALGKIAYPQSRPYLKFIVEKDTSGQLGQLSAQSIKQIDTSAARLSAAQLFFSLGQDYYYHSASLAPAQDADFANIWFWDSTLKRLIREKVDKEYFNELMAMRCCEWALKADPEFGKAIGLWLAAFFKAESTGLDMPEYFGSTHASPAVYATTAGPEYLHQALARALKDKNAYVALGAVEALATTAGEKSLLYRLDLTQPLIDALSFDDKAVRYSAAIAIAAAGPKRRFAERSLVVKNLTEALQQTPTQNNQASANPVNWDQQMTDSYALRAATVMLKLAQTQNRVIDLSDAKDTLIEATKDTRPQIQTLSGQILAHLESPDAQRAIAAMALSENNSKPIRISAFNSLAVSAKLNANLLDEATIDHIYLLVGSQQADPQLRGAAAIAYGALNLPSKKVKDLILDQARS